MREPVYNSAIPDVSPNTAIRGLISRYFPSVAQFLFVILGLVAVSYAADWSGPEQQLARKIVALTGPGAVAITFENRSSLSRRDSEIVENGLRSSLEELGLRFVVEEQSAATIKISLSENGSSFVWVAEIRQGAGQSEVAMVSTPRAEGSIGPRDSVPPTLRKIPLWSQSDPILDVAVLEENTAPSRIAVLDPGKLSLYRMQAGKWQLEQALEIVHAKPWPRDMRGRLLPARDHVLDVYLPGVLCHASGGGSLALSCRESDDPWPLAVGIAGVAASPVFPGESANGVNANSAAGSASAAVVPQMKAFYAPARNFFTGVLTPGAGKFTAVPKFFSAAWVPREKYTLWLFATTDGQFHLVDGVTDQTAKLGWGSDLTSVRSACGAGWQVLASSAGDGPDDSVRAYEFPDRDPVAVSAAVDFSGSISALWTEARGDTAIAVAQNREKGTYDAFRVAPACTQ
jgi:hypothetical protein